MLIENRDDAHIRPACEISWEIDFQRELPEFDQIYEIPFRCTQYTKYQSFQYKIIHRIIPSNHWLHKLKIKESAICTFCQREDTLMHFFILCPKTLLFWKSVYNWWNSLEVPEISYVHNIDIIFGYPDNTKYGNAFNYILLIARYHVYKQKMQNLEPFFPSMLVSLKNQLRVDEKISFKNGNSPQFEENFAFVYNML